MTVDRPDGPNLPAAPAGAANEPAIPLPYEALQDTVARTPPEVSRNRSVVIMAGTVAVALLLITSAEFFVRLDDAGARKSVYCLAACVDLVGAAVICFMTNRFVRKVPTTGAMRWRGLGLLLIGLGVLWLLQGACFVSHP